MPLVSTIAGGLEDFYGTFGGVPVAEWALPVRHAPIVLDPIPKPFNDRLGFNPYTLRKPCVDGLLTLGRCPQHNALLANVWGGRRMPRV